MQSLYYRSSLLAVVALMMTCLMAQAQPNGSYGTKSVSYAPPSGAKYASPNGSGTSCSLSNPCSLSKAISSAPSGGTVVLRGGTYRIVNKKVPRTMTLQPYKSEKVVIKGTKVAKSWSSSGSTWVTSWSTLFPAEYSRSKSSIVTDENPMAAHADMVFVNGSELKQVGSKSSVGSGKFYVDYSNKRIYIGTNPGGKKVEITAGQWGLHTYQVSASGIKFRGIEFQQYAEAALMMRSPSVTIENCRFLNNATAGIKAYHTPKIKVINNLFAKNGLHGIGANGADGMTFKNNKVVQNNAQKFNRNSWSAAGAKFLDCTNATIENNQFKDNDANGIWLDGQSDHTVVVNNELEDNARHGIHCEISYDVIIAGNVVTGNGNNTEGLTAGGICVAESSDVRVYNNTIVGNVVNLMVTDDKRPEGQVQRYTRNTIIKNNLIDDGTIKSYPAAQTWIKLKKCGDAVIKDMDHNGYHKTSVSYPSMLVRWKVGDNTCGDAERLSTISELRDELGMGESSISLIGSSDPFFVNKSDGNYKMKEGSYAVKAGEAIPSDIKSALGWSVSGKVDMGAYQSNYSASSAPTSGNLPWKETFDLVNGTYKDTGTNGGTAWSIPQGQISPNGIFEVVDKKIQATGTYKEGTWQSEEIDITNNTVKFSLYVKSSGSLESNSSTYDYVKVYYKVDGGSSQKVTELKGNVSGKTVTATGIKGSKLQIIVKLRNSDRSESYYLDNIAVESTSSSAPSAPTASADLPWEEQFNNGQDYQGSLETGSMYSYGSLKVSSGKMTARGVGKAAWKSNVIDLNGATAKVSMVLSSSGVLESNDKVKVYYKLNGGSEKLIKEKRGGISGYYMVEQGGISGETLQIVVRFELSDYHELYFLDGVEVVGTSSSSNSAVANNTGAGILSEKSSSMPEFGEVALEVYPNPVVNEVKVTLQSPEAQAAEVNVMDVSGKVIESAVPIYTNEEKSINMSGLPSGVYLLQVKGQDGTVETKRIIKK